MPSIVQAEKAVATKAKNKDGKKPFTERMTVSISPRAKRPHTETTGDDHRDPGSPDRYFEGADVHRPLIQATHGLNHRDNAEDHTRNDSILTRHTRFSYFGDVQRCGRY